MKRSKAEAAQTHKRIVETAAKTFTRNGIRATGVAEIMAAAGLTHGAFYRHFDSKEQLVAQACAASLASLVDSAGSVASEGNGTFLTRLENFLASECHEHGLTGCPFVAMGSELARADPETRRAASVGFLELVNLVASRESFEDVASAKDDAIFILTSMIGAVTMSRIVDDASLSDQILTAAKERLAGVAEAPRKRNPQRRAA
jgi:TetR/AcrR family transcriptional regulator, transcriptional repressor for nem operon